MAGRSKGPACLAIVVTIGKAGWLPETPPPPPAGLRATKKGFTTAGWRWGEMGGGEGGGGGG